MPVEIRELIIRAVVQDSPASNDNEDSVPAALDTDAIIDECVRQILKILKAMEER